LLSIAYVLAERGAAVQRRLGSSHGPAAVPPALLVAGWAVSAGRPLALVRNLILLGADPAGGWLRGDLLIAGLYASAAYRRFAAAPAPCGWHPSWFRP
jgi:hypothetical protein